MEGYFAEGLDVGDAAVLARLAGEVGLDAAEAAHVLESGGYGEEVRAGEAEAREREIFAVPTFVLGGLFAVPGAQEPETFVSLLARVRQRLEEAEQAADVDVEAAQACAVDDGTC
jgi:predicted DsbA family dithiol-disulfide isomerase